MARNKLKRMPKDKDPSPVVYQGAAVKYSGPLPPPGLLQGYGDIEKSFPERIMADFEKNSQHFREQEMKSLELQARDTQTGQWMAFAIIMTGLLGTIALAYAGKDYAAIATAVGTSAMIFKGIFRK